jgi:hypothetical protein
MDEIANGIRPETLALDALIEATIECSEGKDGTSRTDTMLFLGNRHVSFPTLVVQDPVLEPVDKLIWMAILLQANQTDGSTAFPSYDYLRKTANVSSKSTVARAISILRATRWLTLYARMRGRSGRFRGNVFALHDEPLPLVDALHLDTSYMQFLRESQSNVHARVRAVANGVLESIDENIQAGHDVCSVEDPRVRRIEAAEAIRSDAPRPFFSFSAKVMTGLRNHSPLKNSDLDQNQKSNLEDHRVRNSVHQKSNPGSCSSSDLIKTTTTTETAKRIEVPVAGKDDRPLIYPKRLSDNQRELAGRYLSQVSAYQRQLVLDELEGRFRSEKKGMQPLYDEMSFLFSLCKAMKKGEFKENLGIRVREERIAREKARQKRQQQSGHSHHTDNKTARRGKEIGKRAVEEMRKSMGLPRTGTNFADTDNPK